MTEALARAVHVAASPTADPTAARAALAHLLGHVSEQLAALSGRPVPPAPAPAGSRYLNYEQAARYCECSKKTLQNAKSAGELAAVLGGPGVRFTKSSLDKWRHSPRPRRS